DSSGLYCFAHRYYAPWMGRWMSADPIGPSESPNVYEYCHDNPVTLFDPTGLQPAKKAPDVQWKTVGDVPEEVLNQITPEELQMIMQHTHGWWFKDDGSV